MYRSVKPDDCYWSIGNVLLTAIDGPLKLHYMHCVHSWANNVGGVVLDCFFIGIGIMTISYLILYIKTYFCRGSMCTFYSFDQAWSNGMVEMYSERWSWNWYPKGWTREQQTFWPRSRDSSDCWKNDGNHWWYLH